MKLTESKLQKIIREEAKRLVLEQRKEEIVQTVFDKLDATRGLSPRFQGEDTIKVGDHSLRFIEESPVHLIVSVSGSGMFREFNFDLTTKTNIPEKIMDRIRPFITT